MGGMTAAHAPGQIPEITKGDRYRRARINTGIGSAEFAELIGVSRNTVSAIESDRTPVRRIVANAWAFATGVPLVWLETGKVPSPNGDGTSDECAIRDSNPEPADKCTVFTFPQVTGAFAGVA